MVKKKKEKKNRENKNQSNIVWFEPKQPDSKFQILTCKRLNYRRNIKGETKMQHFGMGAGWQPHVLQKSHMPLQHPLVSIRVHKHFTQPTVQVLCLIMKVPELKISRLILITFLFYI